MPGIETSSRTAAGRCFAASSRASIPDVDRRIGIPTRPRTAATKALVGASSSTTSTGAAPDIVISPFPQFASQEDRPPVDGFHDVEVRDLTYTTFRDRPLRSGPLSVTPS